MDSIRKYAIMAPKTLSLKFLHPDNDLQSPTFIEFFIWGDVFRSYYAPSTLAIQPPYVKAYMHISYECWAKLTPRCPPLCRRMLKVFSTPVWLICTCTILLDWKTWKSFSTNRVANNHYVLASTTILIYSLLKYVDILFDSFRTWKPFVARKNSYLESAVQYSIVFLSRLPLCDANHGAD